MPYADPEKRRLAKAAQARRRRARRRLEKAPPPFVEADQVEHDDPAAAVAEWASSTLVVPPGHPRAGEPMALPDYGVAFIRDALSHRESALIVARKNAKSAIVAVLLLAHLAGPLRRLGWRAGVVSIDRAKAGELADQIENIANASEIQLTVRRSPRSVSSPAGRVDILAAEAGAGHASGFDLTIVDELGLLQERDRQLVAGMRSSVSARGGRFMALTIHGDGPFVPEILAREDDPSVAVHHYRPAADDCALDDEEAWAAANPGLATIKSVDYMRDEARRVLLTPADQPSFRAHDLNLAGSPSRETLLNLSDWRRCVVDVLPERDASVVVGFDLGGSASMTAACALWPRTGRLELWGAFPGTPDLVERGKADGVGALYQRMEERGELQVFDGRVTPVGRFLRGVADRLTGERVIVAGADRYRQNEAQQALDDAGVRWPIAWRGTGASKTADGSHDVRAFQRAALSGKLFSLESVLMAHALSESAIRYDGSGNPALEKARSKGRIDVASAVVIAAGLAELERGRKRPVRPPRLHVVGAA